MRKPSAQLLDLLRACAPDIAHLALALRELVLNEAPEAEELLYSVYAEVIVFKLSGDPGGAFCYVAAYSRHVNLGFNRGAELPDPHRVLKGTGKKMRHIRFDSSEGFKITDICRATSGRPSRTSWLRPEKVRGGRGDALRPMQLRLARQRILILERLSHQGGLRYTSSDPRRRYFGFRMGRRFRTGPGQQSHFRRCLGKNGRHLKALVIPAPGGGQRAATRSISRAKRACRFPFQYLAARLCGCGLPAADQRSGLDRFREIRRRCEHSSRNYQGTISDDATESFDGALPIGAASRNQGAAGLRAGGGEGWAEIEGIVRDARRRHARFRAARQDRNGQGWLPDLAAGPAWVYELVWARYAEPLDGASTAHFGLGEIAELLDSSRQKQVIDKTGLAGKYDFTLVASIARGGRSPQPAGTTIPKGDRVRCGGEAARAEAGGRESVLAISVIIERGNKTPAMNRISGFVGRCGAPHAWRLKTQRKCSLLHLAPAEVPTTGGSHR